MNAYGGRFIPLYTPYEWDTGSSVSHLDDYTFSGSSRQLMNATSGPGPGNRALSAIEVGILQDLGYTVQNPLAASMVFLGFLLTRRRQVK